MAGGKKILMITPLLPFPPKAANHQNMLGIIKLLREMNYEVRLICKIVPGKGADVVAMEKECGAKVLTVPYERQPFNIKGFLQRVRNPLYWDGESYAYLEKDMQDLVRIQLDLFRPDCLWVSYTYLWPFRKLARQRNVPFIVRSHNFEPIQLLQESRKKLSVFLKFTPKLLTEWFSVRFSDYVFAISPKEKRIYESLGAKNVSVLPSGALPFVLESASAFETKKREKLHLFFLGSSYSIPHNKKAAEFLIKEVMPKVSNKAPDKFVLHIVGAKLPLGLLKYCVQDIVYDDYVQNLAKFLEDMDVAVTPSIRGAGMQLKIFEPLARGIPTITSPRGLAGYSFVDGEDVLLASDAKGFAEKILTCRDSDFRRKLSQNAVKKSRLLFDKNVFLEKISSVLNNIKK